MKKLLLLITLQLLIACGNSMSPNEQPLTIEEEKQELMRSVEESMPLNLNGFFYSTNDSISNVDVVETKCNDGSTMYNGAIATLLLSKDKYARFSVLYKYKTENECINEFRGRLRLSGNYTLENNKIKFQGLEFNIDGKYLTVEFQESTFTLNLSDIQYVDVVDHNGNVVGSQREQDSQ